MAISAEFGIPIITGRLTPEQIQAIDVSARLVLYLAGTANTQRGTFYVSLGEFAAWAACSYRQACRAMDDLELAEYVTEVRRRRHGMSGNLGAMWRKAGDADATMPARVYQKVFALRAHADDRHRMRDEVGTQAADLKLWAGVCQEWQKARHNPADVDGLLQCFGRKRDAARKVLSVNNKLEGDYTGYAEAGHELSK